LGPRDWLPDHECARRADIDGIEVFQFFGERGRSEGPVTTDVDPSQQNHECHEFLLQVSLKKTDPWALKTDSPALLSAQPRVTWAGLLITYLTQLRYFHELLFAFAQRGYASKPRRVAASAILETETSEGVNRSRLRQNYRRSSPRKIKGMAQTL